MFESTFGVEPTITDRFFSKDDVCGLPAYQYCYDVELDGDSTTYSASSLPQGIFLGSRSAKMGMDLPLTTMAF